MSLQLPLERLGAEALELPPAERRAADVLLARFDRLDGETTASIAKAASVDPATVVRTSRRLGFEGFEALKLAAARASGATTSVPSTGDEAALTEEAALVRRSMLGDAHQIAAAADTVDAETLASIARTLVNAEMAVFSAVGGSGTLLGLAALRFLALGVKVGWYADSQAQLTAATLLDHSGAVLALSRSGRTSEVLAVARTAKELGADVSVITSARKSPLAALADRMIVITPDALSDRERYVSRSVDAAVLNALEALAYGLQRAQATPPHGQKAMPRRPRAKRK
ncbi:MAG: MurR/RpiR family transcriptional regulator [Chloroflexota bacterium]|nr:MurR/RpiR family transcriptional regulator [Chloroflexota bacterium]